MLPPSIDKDVMVFDYFEKNSKKQQIIRKDLTDPKSKGFDVRNFRF